MGVAKSALQSLSRYLARELGPRGSVATSWPPGRCARWRPSASRGSAVRGHLGRAGAARLGHQRPRAGRPGRASPCSRTGSRPRPARSSTSTAASTPPGPPASRERRRPRRDRRPVNRLATETSPYLRQHRDNPVDWYRGGRTRSPSRVARRPRAALGRLLGVPLVPRDGPRVVRGRRGRGGDERRVRQRQGRPRGATRRRRHLHGRGAGDDRVAAGGR